MPTRTFNTAWLNEKKILPGVAGNSVSHWSFDIEVADRTTWTVIFRHEGTFWKISYTGTPEDVEKGVATWPQEREIEAICVEPVIVNAIQWHTVGRPRTEHPSTAGLNAAVKVLTDENRGLREAIGRLRFALENGPTQGA